MFCHVVTIVKNASPNVSTANLSRVPFGYKQKQTAISDVLGQNKKRPALLPKVNKKTNIVWLHFYAN